MARTITVSHRTRRCRPIAAGRVLMPVLSGAAASAIQMNNPLKNG